MQPHYTPTSPKIERVCQECGEPFYVEPWKLRYNACLYCSRACAYKHRTTPREVRFWRFVHKTDTCWVWTGGKHRFGYGKIDGLDAHRVSWEIHNGPVPSGMYVCHHCDNPACIRPDHLFLGTQTDNMRDMSRKGRGARGETTPGAKMTAEKVRQLRERYAQGDISMKAVGEMFGIKPHAVWAIIHRKTWQHVE